MHLRSPSSLRSVLLKMRWIIALFLASSLASAAEQVPLGGGAYSPLDGDFEHLVKQKLSEWHVPGVSVAVVHNNKTYAKVPIVENPCTTRFTDRLRATGLPNIHHSR